MGSSKKKGIDLDVSGLENISKQISGLTNKIEKELQPLMELNDLESSIEQIKNVVNMTKDIKDSSSSEDEGETCMHDNSWHSNCSDCEELNTIDDLFTLVENTPNDKELGKKIRQIYWAYTNDNADSGDEPSDKQLNLFD